jgi:hypothetical protein
VRENGGVSDQPTPASEPVPERDRVTVRRAPRISAFLVVGGFLGFLVTLIVTSLFEADPGVGFAASLAYFSLYGVSAGVLVGAVLAVLADRRSRRRARMIEVEREEVAAEPEAVQAQTALPEAAEPEPIEPEQPTSAPATSRDDDTPTA